MSKKTKREKIITDLRRKLSVQSTNRPTEEEKISPVKNVNTLNYSFKPQKPAPVNQIDQDVLLIQRKYFITDISKTFRATALILFIEFALYWFFEINKGIKIF